MKLIISDINSILEKRVDINNESGELLFYSQPDFAYKHRVHIYDNKDEEIGYVQYIILSSQTSNEIYTSQDELLNLSNLKDDISIKNNVIEVNDECNLNEYILLAYSLIG